MEKRGLGRGLAALIPEAPMVESGASVQQVPVTQVSPNPYQPRTLFDPLKMEELVGSVREHGVLQPVLLRRVGMDRYQLVAGERRFRAAQAAGLDSIPALIREITEREQLEIAVVENLQREDIGAMESARAYRRLIDEFNLTQEVVSQRVGKSRSAVANTLRLLSLPEPVQDSLERGEISEGHARALLMADDPETILSAWQTVSRRGLNVRDTEKLAKDLKANRNSGVAPVKASGSVSMPSARQENDPNIADITDKLQQALGTKVILHRSSSGKGRLEIEFFSSQELERIVDYLLGPL